MSVLSDQLCLCLSDQLRLYACTCVVRRKAEEAACEVQHGGETSAGRARERIARSMLGGPEWL